LKQETERRLLLGAEAGVDVDAGGGSPDDLGLESPVGAPVALEASTDVTHCSILTEFTTQTAITDLSRWLSPSDRQRFYRARGR
jgi:hypothetical protein